MKKLILLLGFALFGIIGFGQTQPFRVLTTPEPDYIYNNYGTQPYRFFYEKDTCIVSYGYVPVVYDKNIIDRPVDVYRKHGGKWTIATLVPIQKDNLIWESGGIENISHYWTGFSIKESGQAVKYLKNGNIAILLMNYHAKNVSVKYFTFKIIVLVPTDDSFNPITYIPNINTTKDDGNGYLKYMFSQIKDIDITKAEFEVKCVDKNETVIKFVQQ